MPVHPKEGQEICTKCGTSEHIKEARPGSLLIEIVLWLTCLGIASQTKWPVMFVAFVYSLWRFFTPPRPKCTKCGSLTVVDANPN